jgi:hypothetical protein
MVQSRAVVAHAFNPSTWEAEAGGFLSLRPALVYKVSSRTARATQRNPVSKNKKKKIVFLTLTADILKIRMKKKICMSHVQS